MANEARTGSLSVKNNTVGLQTRPGFTSSFLRVKVRIKMVAVSADEAASVQACSRQLKGCLHSLFERNWLTGLLYLLCVCCVFTVCICDSTVAEALLAAALIKL